MNMNMNRPRGPTAEAYNNAHTSVQLFCASSSFLKLFRNCFLRHSILYRHPSLTALHTFGAPCLICTCMCSTLSRAMPLQTCPNFSSSFAMFAMSPSSSLSTLDLFRFSPPPSSSLYLTILWRREDEWVCTRVILYESRSCSTKTQYNFPFTSLLLYHLQHNKCSTPSHAKDSFFFFKSYMCTCKSDIMEPSALEKCFYPLSSMEPSSRSLACTAASRVCLRRISTPVRFSVCWK